MTDGINHGSILFKHPSEPTSRGLEVAHLNGMQPIVNVTQSTCAPPAFTNQHVRREKGPSVSAVLTVDSRRRVE